MTSSCITIPEGTGVYHLPTSFSLESSADLCGSHLAFELVGPDSAPVVLVQGGISSGRRVVSSHDGGGWWDQMAGDGSAIDSSRFRVLSADFLGGDGASTGPVSSGRRPFPAITSGDQARAMVHLLDFLGIETLHAVVGASYGGMVGLALAAGWPRRLGHLVAISAPHRPHPLAVAWRSLQRKIVSLGIELGAPERAVALARGLGMTTYRSVEEFAARFDGAPSIVDGRVTFPVEEYLDARGAAFADSFDPHAFLCLSQAIDLHRVDPSAITVPTTLIGATSDQLVPIGQLRELASALGGAAELVEIDSLYGHDAFLKETTAIGSILRRVLAGQEVSR